MQPEERWVAIADFPGYEVSSLGRVRSFRQAADRPRILKTRTSKGYIRVPLSKDRRQHFRYVHRLVAEAFIGPRPEGMQVHHRDGVRDNNYPSNLCYVTQMENTRKQARCGNRQRPCPSCGVRLSIYINTKRPRIVGLEVAHAD